MDIGQKLLDLRKEKQLSQEEVAEKLDVTRQTISKWETNQSTPDFDKIIPICQLYNITPNELIYDIKKEDISTNDNIDIQKIFNTKKKAKGIGLGIVLYFMAIVWIMITIPVFRMNPIISSGIFLLICGISTGIIVYVCIVYKNINKKELTKEEKVRKQIDDILSIITVIIYLFTSFITGAWHITWLIWIIYGLIAEILKLVFMLKGDKNEE